jgi:hypothetical protein
MTFKGRTGNYRADAQIPHAVIVATTKTLRVTQVERNEIPPKLIMGPVIALLLKSLLTDALHER